MTRRGRRNTRALAKLAALVALALAVGCQTVSRSDPRDAGAWGPQRDGLRTQLGEITNGYARGYLKLLSLSMENVSDGSIRYDDQQVGCNDSLIVRRNGVERVPFRGELVMTIGETKTINSRNIAPLFHGLILEEQYDISRPGLYTVQFRGRPGGGGVAPIPESNIITIRMKR